MADISVKLNGDNSNFKRMIDDSSQAAGTIAGQIAKKFELKDLGKTMATALGINIQNMAEQVARFFTGMTKDEEEAYKRSAELSTQAADAAIKNMRATLSEEQRYLLAIQERDRLQREVAGFVVKTGADQETLYKKQIQLQERIGETLAYEKKQRDEIAKANEAADKQAISYAEKKFEAELETLGASERIKILKQSIAQLEQVIGSGVLDVKNKEQQVNVLAERRLLLLKEQKGEQGEVEKKLTEFFGPLDELSKKEKERLEEQKKITAELEKQKGIVKEVVVETKKLNAEKAITFGVSRENVTELSNTQLASLQTKAMQQLSRAEQKQAASGSVYSMEKNEAADYLNQIMGEINLRKQFSATANFEGGKYNERNYDVSTFERLKQLFNPDLANKQSNDISDISKNLRTLLGG